MPLPRRPLLAAPAAVFLLAALPAAQPPAPPPYQHDERQVPAYTLPPLLVARDGRPVDTPARWREIRRAELLQDFARTTYGFTPRLEFRLRSRIVATRSDAVGGLATRTLVELSFFDDPAAPKVLLMVYLPNGTKGPVPAMVGLNYYGVASVEPDPALPLTDRWMRPVKEFGIVNHRATEATRGSHAIRWPLELALRRGYAVATYYYGDLEPDHGEGWRDGLRGYLLRREGRAERGPEEWGAIGVWAWGLSRAREYLATLPAIDARRIAVFGHSRHGKTALWAGAQDEAFAAVISNNSGEGGASLGRREFGERIVHSVRVNHFWYCPNYASYAGRESARPVDQHMLVALAAPRPVYVASATEDLGADPRGEYLAAYHAGPAYALFGLAGLASEASPPPDTPVGARIGYHLRTGAHNILAYDWARFLDFLDREWRAPR